MEKKPDNRPSLSRRFQAAARKLSRKAVAVPFAAAVILSAPALAYAPQTAQPSTQQLFLQNADFVTQKAPSDATRAQQADYYIQAVCRPQTALLPPAAPTPSMPAPANKDGAAPVNDNSKVQQAQAQVADALKVLDALPLTGKPLLDAAAENDVQFCPLDSMPIGVAALYLPDINAVASGPVYMGGDRMMQIAHELTHAVQYKNGLLNYGYNWDIESRVQRNTATEAAAMTMEFMAAYDAKLHGNDSYWIDLKENHAFAYGNRQIYQTIDDTYQANIAAGKTQQEALNAAGFLVWQDIFQSAGWRTFYLNTELMSYMRDIDNGVYTRISGVAYNQFTQDKVDAAGRIGVGPSFTAGEKMPSLTDILAGDKKMTWAYQAVDIARYAQAWGNDDARVKNMRVEAAKDGNPYLSLDIKDMYRRAEAETWKHGPGKRLYYVYQVMDAALAEQASNKITEQAAPQPSQAQTQTAVKPQTPPKAA